MKELLIMRHAKSSWSNMYQSDYDRPLNSRGKNDAPRMGRLLKSMSSVPDLIVASSAERARTTAELVAAACGYETPIIFLNAFYLAPPSAYLEYLVTISDEHSRVLTVGHNPGVEELISELTGQYRTVTTANIAAVELRIKSWSMINANGSGRLAQFWQPKELPAE